MVHRIFCEKLFVLLFKLSCCVVLSSSLTIIVPLYAFCVSFYIRVFCRKLWFQVFIKEAGCLIDLGTDYCLECTL